MSVAFRSDPSNDARTIAAAIGALKACGVDRFTVTTAAMDTQAQ